MPPWSRPAERGHSHGVALPQQNHACTKFPSLLSVVQHGQRQLNSSEYFTPRRASQAKMDDLFRSRKTPLLAVASLSVPIHLVSPLARYAFLSSFWGRLQPSIDMDPITFFPMAQKWFRPKVTLFVHHSDSPILTFWETRIFTEQK